MGAEAQARHNDLCRESSSYDSPHSVSLGVLNSDDDSMPKDEKLFCRADLRIEAKSEPNAQSAKAFQLPTLDRAFN